MRALPPEVVRLPVEMTLALGIFSVSQDFNLPKLPSSHGMTGECRGVGDFTGGGWWEIPIVKMGDLTDL